jgi:LysM repeat protein
MRKNPAAKRTKINQYLNRRTQKRQLKMNNQNPLIPQGSTLEQKNRGRARMKIAVFFVLAIHGVGLMALLMQGCGQSKEPTPPTETVASNQPPAFVETTNPPVATATSTPPVAVSAPAAAETPAQPVVPADATEYTIAKGDILDSIAKKFHISLKAITEANPGIQPTKLQIGQKIHIPAPATSAAPTATGIAAAESPSAGGEQTYSVKSGDNLTKIATQHGISVKALRAANALKTDSIKVGQKLKIPAKSASAPATPPTTPTEPAATSTTSPSPTPPPGR